MSEITEDKALEAAIEREHPSNIGVFSSGWQAARGMVEIDDCPYKEKLRRFWLQGFHAYIDYRRELTAFYRAYHIQWLNDGISSSDPFCTITRAFCIGFSGDLTVENIASVAEQAREHLKARLERYQDEPYV